MRSGRFLPCVAAWALMGCATDVAPPADGATLDAEAATGATAIVSVERTTNAGRDTTRAEAIARFVRMRSGSVDDAALRMVGAAVDVPAIGTCASVSTATRDSGAAGRAVSLVDVGSVAVEAASITTPLHARELPDVADLVSGVVYTARTDEALLPARASYLLHTGSALGKGDADASSVLTAASAPGDLTGVRIGAAVDTADTPRRGVPIVLPTSTSVDVRWDAGSADDVVYVDITSVDPPATVRCAFADVGGGTLPAVGWPDDEGTLTVHRLHREPFQAPGIAAGEVRFDFAQVTPFLRR